MIKEVAKVLRNRLQFRGDIPFLDVYAGLVQTVSYKSETAGGGTMVKRMPVSYDTNLSAGCDTSPEKAIIPDSSKKGIIYFEENGGAQPFRTIAGGATFYRLGLTAVVWLNRAKITGDDYSEISGNAFAEIKKKLFSNDISDPFHRLTVTDARFRQNDSVFSKYSYDETVMQHLRPPYEYFAVDLTVTFLVPCSGVIELNPKNC